MRTCYVYLFVLMVCTCHLFANSRYEQITNSAGLSNSAINCIAQDSAGIMWFGTWDGLNSFDGKEIRVYKPEPGNPNSISNNIIRNIIEQRKGILWVVTDHGINRRDASNHSFRQFYFGYEDTFPAVQEIYSIAKTEDNRIFCAAMEQGIYFYAEGKNEFMEVNSTLVHTQDVRKIVIDKNDQLWILHKDGQVDLARWKQTNEYPPTITHVVRLNIPSVRLMYAENDYVILLDSDNKVHVYASIVGKKVFEFDLKKIDSHIDVIQLDIIDQSLFVSSSAGSYYTLFLDNFSQPVFNEDLKGSRIRAFYKCKQNLLWIGSDGDGIFINFDKNTFFHTIQLKKEMNVVRAFCEDINKQLWVGSKGGGIAVLKNDYNSEAKIVAEYNTSNGLLHNSVYTITKGFGNTLFIGTDGQGINVYANGRLSTLRMDNLPVEFASTYSIYCSEKDSTLWIGTSGYGLIKLRVEEKNGYFRATDYKQYIYDGANPASISNNVIYSILPEDDTVLWIATRGGGLNRFHIAREEFQSYRYDVNNPATISSNDVLCLYKDKRENLWIGTSGGLNFLSSEHEDEAVFVRYNQSNGLPNNTVHGILEDNEGNIWISTNKGIARLNKADNSINSFYEQNGLQNNEFSDGAYYQSIYSNYLFLGGISGINMFDPGEIALSSYLPPFYISSFRVFSEEKNIDKRIVKNVQGEDELILAYDENFFSFNFLSLDYIQNENCEYIYQLEGIDKEPVYNGNLGYLSYTNISPGKYTLSIYYTNSDKVWVKQPYRLHITIKNPYWKTPLAYLLYFLLAILLCALIYRFMYQRFTRKRKMLIEQLRVKEQENIHEAKLRFFTNIAHELYTPITLIYGPCEKILDHETNDEYVKKYIRVIQSNAERMKSLIGELLEFRKAETGHTRILPLQLNVSELLRVVSDHFIEVAEEHRIDFTIHFPENDISWVTDRDSLEKIIFNIIANAFKYTPPDGYITIDIGSDETHLLLSVINSGKGIAPDKLAEVFNRFKILDDFENQIEKGQSGRNGIGLALTKSLVNLLKGEITAESVLGENTTFIIRLPLLEKADIPVQKEKTEEEKAVELPIVKPQQIPSGKDGSPLILIIDDEEEIRELLRDTLGAKYGNIIEASNGREALNLMTSKRPNLIICDIIMPEMNGLEFIREIKNNIFTKHLPVIFLTAKSSVEDQIIGTQSGSDIYITKPFHPKHILSVVENILVKHKLIEEYYNSPATAYELLDNGKVVRKEDKSLMIKAIDFIEQHMEGEDLSPTMISDYLGISKMTFYRKTKELLDMAPSEFIRTIKMNKVAYLLVSTNLTIQEIMFRCGFNNKSYFYREFQNIYNMTPKEYKNQGSPHK
ncbi:signal transduction histidine kinase/ligand-binding sensor domain-containing protein/CheY-like chemotaxis protein/AraC-like DNA-binding protein [Parabacteroides sp. PF5-5]|uniref:hybrid sensor histidine kinase/response regulator transcription factor n=1 Tax=unclassified Parabacteroides TaxID=2649774 RepID=UPI0024761178|nr:MULTISPECIES: hybrid sensor histidine kinase/response regulator transcription factor [unclassified Parabacteroides]MDH6304858.1 signal transduction histidine kinase/ligand-binding sensor domain-containing protein/CheY-like chemotaxis protein/AraC-like DNA-binding protein [Parabacteroides sp. PH5-39]MDH6316056.1 signal transduction histidine kinase/ligand-binding sensor domain-containing protein/CheY-like chemotaxis protein/AraC-like DNA-binding protein [Parabacteroides sp. PF5-13]MDH6319713.1